MATSSQQRDMRPASGRCLGQVRKCLGRKKWSARFQFRMGGNRTTIDGPVRMRQTDAEADRKLIAGRVAQVCLSLKPETAKAVVAILQTGRRRLPAKVPGSASNASKVGFAKLAQMNLI